MNAFTPKSSSPDSLKKSFNSPVVSWAQWFDRAALLFEDPRMKIAYYRNGKTPAPYSQRAVRATVTHIWKKLGCHHDDVVLDIGCGVGFLTQAFIKNVQMIIGVDIAPSMIKSALELNPGGTFLVCKASALCFKPNQFNRIVSYGVTQYMANVGEVKAMLDDIIPLLKSNGKILIGDILEPLQASAFRSYKKVSPKGDRWWPEELDHTLSKLYIPKDFFVQYCRNHKLTCSFFRQKILGRSIPTPRYDVVIQNS